MADTTISSLNTVNALSAINYIPISDGTNTTKLGTDSLFGFRNRLINGDMRIDQRNAGTAITITNTSYPWAYSIDRWSIFNYQPSKLSVQKNMDSLVPPQGFTNYVGIKTISPYSIGANDTFGIHQRIEGNNCYDLDWGTNNSKTITLSFWVRCTKTGTFAGQLSNNNDNRWYTFTYSINSLNTWEYKTITIPGDTTGNWYTDERIGVIVGFYVGAGSNLIGPVNTWSNNRSYPAGGGNILDTLGAAFYVTGVQFEIGTTATPFERRPISTELAMCQRYYEKSYNQTKSGFVFGINDGESSGMSCPVALFRFGVRFAVTKRAVPTINTYDSSGNGGSGSNARYSYYSNAWYNGGIFDTFTPRASDAGFYVGTGGGGIVEGQFGWTANAEL
jgi:hypothetical protein